MTEQNYVERFRDNNDGTVMDRTTDLIWTKIDNGNDILKPYAEGYVHSLVMGGITDWRLPTVTELIEIIDYIVKMPVFKSGTCFWTNQSDLKGGDTVVVIEKIVKTYSGQPAFGMNARVMAVSGKRK